LRSGREVLFPKVEYDGGEYFYAYFPVVVDSTRTSALELAQPLEPMHKYIRSTILRKAVLFGGFIVVGAIVVWWLGASMVGRPVQNMVAQARRVGKGDLDAKTSIGGHRDELAELAGSLNQMVEQLKLAQQRLQEETAKRIETIEQLNRAERLATVGKLASGLAHELGTPLNVVSGRAKMIAGGELGQSEISSSASVIREQSERMTRIIRQLLDFARSRTPQRKDENIRDIAAKTVATLKPIAEQNGVTLVLHPSGSEVVGSVDREQIQQVLSNLIVNAIHAMPDGGDIDITVGREAAVPPADIETAPDEVVKIEVADNGKGIKEEDLERIFTPFFSTKGVGEGTGLGLSIAHGIVREHGGWISVESKVGRGSCFTVYLPSGEAR
jgi:signal transduction histidine kinase